LEIGSQIKKNVNKKYSSRKIQIMKIQKEKFKASIIRKIKDEARSLTLIFVVIQRIQKFENLRD